MRIIITRRITQGFFFFLFLWFCVVATVGENFWQLRGWPVNWLLQLDPLVGLSTLLTTGKLYAGLAWCLVTILGTLFLGRFFCGWVCPFGAMHQFIGYLSKIGQKPVVKDKKNRYHRYQSVKYWILIFLLAAAASDLLYILFKTPWNIDPVRLLAGLLIFLILGSFVVGAFWQIDSKKRGVGILLVLIGLWFAFRLFFKHGQIVSVSLLIGLLDPLPSFFRSVNLTILPIIDGIFLNLTPNQRFFEGAGVIGFFLGLTLALNLTVPRFYCRFICPLGALLGVLSRFALWRIGKKETHCKSCYLCNTDCEGACEPNTEIRLSECVLCLNCLESCPRDSMTYSIHPSSTGEKIKPDLERREIVFSALLGVAAPPVLGLNGFFGQNWNPKIIRPPGSLEEKTFLNRCIKCGQCMRICPTNIIQPAGMQSGIEGLWTPILNFRIGTSGCQMTCIACGNVCPTSAIRPISLEEKLGKEQFVKSGPIRMGMAFVDRSRCLPWAMNKPCIVCQENCPVSPKAIHTRIVFGRLRQKQPFIIRDIDTNTNTLLLEKDMLKIDSLATGDYFLKYKNEKDDALRLITANLSNQITLALNKSITVTPETNPEIEIRIRLQRPVIDPDCCIGCGTCEHECPVSGKRAIRVTAENESRNKKHQLLV